MSTLKDAAQLSAEKKAIRDKLAEVESRQKQLSAILKKKEIEKKKTGDGKSIDPYQTVSVEGKPLSEFRPPRVTKTAALSLPPVANEYRKPKPFRESSDINVAKLRVQTFKRQYEHAASATMKSVDIFDNNRSRNGNVDRIPGSLFPNRYKRGELPCSIEHGTNGHYLSWVCALEKLDYEYYLPLFFDGLQCKEDPLAFLACQGVKDLLEAARGYPERVIPCVPSIVTPIRNGLLKRDPVILLPLLQCMRQLVRVGEGVGEKLITSGVQFLSLLNVYIEKSKNTGDAIDYGQHKNDDLGAEVTRTLEELERFGGNHAFRRIKYSIPTYQSCKNF
mmetsp:Transcript_26253/g.26501  ORF Transcript_26253/g.26501 Transcript_26253/m.26501 type:complete len:334 (+) Transcript_26253:288-1289(+)|eukprot:CAMPEP_0182428580 /NCGR_PEP_ID=MMETSP1167-20130531/23126_1 /TAXON_ID=2988 /ORGANISM="Mallomonas Sp, Strain CCMP3275" /LENGTH=333 /DNA_ID=CAMNT_0024611551 /DNA_START=175 /DNA_END=1176 /DNA_ORIENTATION=+